MFDNLKQYIGKIENWPQLKGADKVDLFAYFLSSYSNTEEFTPQNITKAFNHLKIVPYTNVSRYLKDNSDKGRPKKKKIKFLKTKTGFHLEGHFEEEFKARINEIEIPFIHFSIDANNLEWKPSDIPFLNSKVNKSAEFFTKLYYLLYHLENSIRRFLSQRLLKIIGTNWEVEILQNVDLGKSEAIRRDVRLSEMLPDRGENILFYCMWDDYGKILKKYPTLLINPKESDEILAHLNTLSKIRNAIAHNAATIPKDYQDELTIFLKKYIKIMKTHV